MKAVMPAVTPDIRQWRKRTGADRWDEMWEGVLHMPPAPNRHHQDLEGALEAWLRSHWTKPRGRAAYHQINVASLGGWPHDYRIPDLVLLTPDRSDIDRNEYFEGAPSAVVEIHSPDDETYEKLPFYAKIGVPEVWVIDRDTRKPEVYVLQGADYQEQKPDEEGWLTSGLSIQLRAEADQKLAIRIASDASTRRVLP